MTKPGYFLVARGFLDHPKFRPTGPFSRAEAMLWMFEEAAWEQRTIAIAVHSQRKLVDLQRGQLSHSIRFLAEAWRWSPGRVQRYIHELRDDRTIDTHVDTGQLVVTICNYEEYQSPKKRTGTHADTHSDTHSGTHADTKRKETNESKEDIARSEKDVGSKLSRPKAPSKGDDGFAEWYAAYPRKMQRLDAAKAYAQTMAGGQIAPAVLLERTISFAAQWAKRPKAENQFCPYPASWLRAGGFDDETLAPKSSAPAAPRQRPEEFTTAHWRSVVSVWRQERSWTSEAWGPAPGEPGCMVPPEILGRVGGPPNGVQH